MQTAPGARLPGPGFFVFLSAQVISWLGDHMDRIAIPWLVQELTGTPAALGALTLATTLPDIAATPFTGVMADRYDRRRIMIAVDLYSGLVVGVLAYLAWRGLVAPWHLYLGMALFAVVRSAYGPAAMACLPQLVDPDGLTRANSVVSGAGQVMSLAGPAAAAGAIAVAGMAGAMAADSLTFFASALLLMLVRPRAVPGPTAAAPRRSVWADVVQGPR